MENATLRRVPPSAVASEVFDIIVVGGGVTGAGIALDAASRGLSVLIVEKGDFASGTSSKSTKLVHGGLRYLQNLQFGVVLESVRERQLLSKLAPHMVWSVPFVIPQYRGKRLSNLKLKVGLWVYDLMAGVRGTGFHKKISDNEVIERCPGVRQDGLLGGLMYFDCRTDDARHTLELLKTASQFGALAMNYTEVVGLVKENGRIGGIQVVDTLACEPETEPVTISGRVVINATGVWTQLTSELAHDDASTEVVPAKGVHVTLSKSRLPIDCAMILPSPHDKRFCFAVPWYDSILVGTTDTPYDGDFENLRVEDDEMQYVLDSVNAMFPDANITEADVTGSFAGLRPLVRSKEAKGSTADLSRGHSLVRADDGLISIAGGKLTTYRPMARETVDLAVESLTDKNPDRRIGKSVTEAIMLGSWSTADDVANLIDRFGRSAETLGLTQETGSYLPTAYGKNTASVLALVESDPELSERISDSHPYILAQIVYAIRAESAMTLDDVLSRRIRLSITDRKAALAAAELVASVMASELGWSSCQRAEQIAQFTNLFAKER